MVSDLKKLRRLLRSKTKSGIDDFVDFVVDSMSGMKDHFGSPDDDWQPTVFAVDDKGDVSITAFQVPSHPTARDVLFTLVLPRAIKQTGSITMAVLVNSGWTLDPEDMKEYMADDSMTNMSDHPNHREILTVMYGDKTGRRGMRRAYILRDDEQPPGLSEWETFDDPEISSTGRISKFFDELLRD